MDGLTHVFCVRHALPDLSADDRGRPLTEEGRADALRVAEFFREISLDCAVSSPYLRSRDTIRPAAAEHGLTIREIEDFRERTCGDTGGETAFWLRRRWEDFDAAEPDGECLRSVETRNMRAFTRMLDECRGKNVLFGTHGTALSVILHHYDPAWDLNSFNRIAAWMPWIVRMDFDGQACTRREELFHIDKRH